jgi:hypothetical protein
VKPKEHQKGKYVDATGIGGRKKLLPGEVSSSTCGKDEKSAEAIVVIGNEPRALGEDSPDNEGLNVKQLQMPNGVFTSRR